MNTNDPRLMRELTDWFRQRLEEDDFRFRAGESNHEFDTACDSAFYSLQAEAGRYWERHYGFMPTPAELSQAFFRAEHERFEAQRMAPIRWMRGLKRWLKTSLADTFHHS